MPPRSERLLPSVDEALILISDATGSLRENILRALPTRRKCRTLTALPSAKKS